MLFNSYTFVFLFLPIVIVGFFAIARASHTFAAGWLGLASLFFYGWWDWRYVPLLLASIVGNYLIGLRIGHAQGAARRSWLVVGIVADLALLMYFKYADFFVATVNAVAGSDIALLHVVLPIGISFYTFTQIAFLADTYQRKASEYRFVHYLLFVTYFPHLIAGPILHHKEMMPQFADPRIYRASARDFAIGLTIFAIGLAKKVLVADSLAPHAAAVFDRPDQPSLAVAWGGVLAYSFQLYFDFSGYSDMAIGISRVFGVKLPLNFDSPYRARNITEFWRRWHMTLSRFLRDYLYIPLGGNQRGPIRRYANLLITMLLGGLWHGAGWNFVIWGGLHGTYLVVHHAWVAFTTRMRIPVTGRLWTLASVIVTFAVVCFAWAFFRAADLAAALQIVKGMLGMNGVALPDAFVTRFPGLRSLTEGWGITFYLGGGTRFVQTWSWVAGAAALAFLNASRPRLQHRHRRQCLALEEFEEGAAAGRDVADPVRHAELRDGGKRVAAAGDRERVALRDRFGDRLGAAGERVELEHAHRAVPEDGAGARDDRLQRRHRRRPEVEDEIVGLDVLDRLQRRRALPP